MTTTAPDLRSAAPRGSCPFCDFAEPSVVSHTSLHVVPSVGSLVPGWLLAIPRQHVVAFADLTSGELAAADRLCDDLRARLRRTYGKAVVTFEHGPAATGRPAGCGVDHAHLHLVPTDLDVLAHARRLFDVEFHPVASLRDAVDSHRAGRDYLYLRDQTGQAWLGTGVDVPSQAFRRAIADALNEPCWDWKEAARREVYDATVRTLRR